MNRNIVNIASLLLTLLIILTGCAKTTSLEGKVVDGKGKPMAGVKMIARLLKPSKGHEQLETTTDTNGNFRFENLLPASEYEIVPLLSDTRVNAKRTIKGPPKGEAKILDTPLMIRLFLKNNVVTDTKTDLMWAARDNGADINWSDAEAYCSNYEGGGFSDWRMPTQDELAELYEAGINGKENPFIEFTACCPWASETHGNKASGFNFFYTNGRRFNFYKDHSADYPRALPVRNDN